MRKTWITYFILLPVLGILIANNQTVPTEKISKTELLGQVDPSQNKDFVTISPPYASRSGMYLRKEAFDAYKKMYDAAAAEDLNLMIVSAFRSFNHQKRIWEAKWTGARKVMGQNLASAYPNGEERAAVILMFSAMPGTSRHHWGTDVDIYSVEDDDFEQGRGKKIYEWLQKNAAQYGFCQIYTPKDSLRPTGYEEEKWHWSYKPLAEKFQQAYQKKISYQDISGFKGDRTAKRLKIIQDYVLAVNPACNISSERP